MSLAVVADPELRERMRCIRIITDQARVSALGVASWNELDQVLIDSPGVGLLFYSHPMVGAPQDAIERLLACKARLVLATGDSEEVPPVAGLTRTTRPIADETLVLMARKLGSSSIPPQATFAPVDFLQMICMSGASHVLVLTQDGSDAGVIEVRAGEVWTAFDGVGAGEEAFARLIRPEMRARITPAVGSTKERTIWKGLHELVLESLRLMDEGQVMLPRPLSAGQLEATLASPAQLADRVQQLSVDARRLLMARSYDEAARVLISLAELDPASHLVRANLEQLRRLGYPK
jgi:Domain of unknown function (DUF4388)